MFEILTIGLVLSLGIDGAPNPPGEDGTGGTGASFMWLGSGSLIGASAVGSGSGEGVTGVADLPPPNNFCQKLFFGAGC
jgi:hypothetical protein